MLHLWQTPLRHREGIPAGSFSLRGSAAYLGTFPVILATLARRASGSKTFFQSGWKIWALASAIACFAALGVEQAVLRVPAQRVAQPGPHAPGGTQNGNGPHRSSCFPLSRAGACTRALAILYSARYTPQACKHASHGIFFAVSPCRAGACTRALLLAPARRRYSAAHASRAYEHAFKEVPTTARPPSSSSHSTRLRDPHKMPNSRDLRNTKTFTAVMRARISTGLLPFSTDRDPSSSSKKRRQKGRSHVSGVHRSWLQQEGRRAVITGERYPWLITDLR